MKMLGAKKVGVLTYGAASSSVSTAKSFMNYAVPGVGSTPPTQTPQSTSVPLMSDHWCSASKARAPHGVYLPMAAATNIAVAQGLEQSGVKMKASLLATGYGRTSSNSPTAKLAAPQHRLLGARASRSSSRTRPPSCSRPTSRSTPRSPASRTSGCTPGLPSSPTSSIAGLPEAGEPADPRGLIDGTPQPRHVQPGQSQPAQSVDVSLAGAAGRSIADDLRIRRSN